MIARQAALLKRELWEHRSICITPVVIALIIVLLSITGQVSVSAFDEAVDTALIGASHLTATERAAIGSVMMTGVASFFVLAMLVLVVFYALDALYAERKDRSILFWRSLPCTDTETVLAKLATALLVIPLITFAAVAITHILVFAGTSIWLALRNADAWHLLWTATPFAVNWAAMLVFFIALSLWLAPLIGWFLFVSAFARRSPLLLAFLPLAVLPLLERSLLGGSLLADAFFTRSVSLPLFVERGTAGLMLPNREAMLTLQQVDSANLFALIDLPRFLGSLSLWLGLLVCGLLTAAAIYVRRYRDDG